MAKAQIIRVNPIELPPNQPLRRQSPRKLEDRNAGFDELYDDTTLFYDVIASNDRICLVGPAAENLSSELQSADYSLDDQPLETSFATSPKVLRMDAPLPSKAVRASLKLQMADISLTGGVSPAQHDLFAGLNVIQTMNKDNELSWIRDWATYYVKAHGATGVLFYENSSKGYSLEQLAETLESVAGLRQIVIVEWPFKYGPQGFAANGPSVWDSDYSQVASFEHARRRFLGRARGWLNCDIDELVVTESRGSVFEAARRSDSIGVCYPGLWISPVASDDEAPSIFQEFPFLMSDAPACPNKWCVIPERMSETTWMTVHASRGQQLEKLVGANYRHYRGVSNGWKYQRARSTATDASLETDTEMMGLLQQVFSSQTTTEKPAGNWLGRFLKPSQK